MLLAALLISAISFVIIVNLRLRFVRENELAIGQRYCAKKILILLYCKYQNFSSALNEKRCLEISYTGLKIFIRNRMIELRSNFAPVTSANNCYRLILDTYDPYR